jgi:hypothetical protein
VGGRTGGQDGLIVDDRADFRVLEADGYRIRLPAAASCEPGRLIGARAPVHRRRRAGRAARVDLMLRPCLVCGRLAQRSGCRICTTKRSRTNPYTTPTWRQLSLAVVERDGACVRCGGSFVLSAHHLIPRAEGGLDALENLEAVCVVCHGQESGEEWRSGRY